jgi:hypothetical protein
MLKSWRIPEIAAHMRQAMEFGSVAGLMAAYLTGEGVAEKVAAPKVKETKALEVAVHVGWMERWVASLRGFLKWSPS